MSEYWKSAPKYWCKHCKTYVRDTKLERQNHEATGKHQGAIKRFLRDLHRGHEREDREKQKAKDEISRLNGITPSKGGNSLGAGDTEGSASTGAPWRRVPNNTTSSNAAPNPAERARQVKQLAEMGVTVPEEFRRELAMTGQWETVSQRIVKVEDHGSIKQEEGADAKRVVKNEAPLNIGVKRRRIEGEDDMEDAGESVVKKGWGSTTKGWSDVSEELDLEALMGQRPEPIQKEIKSEDESPVQPSEAISDAPHTAIAQDPGAYSDSQSPLKKEESLPTAVSIDKVPSYDINTPSKEEAEEALNTSVVFKKRKRKPMRQG